MPVTCEPELGLVEIDEVQFVQVLLNLAVNARDAMPQGGRLTVQTENVDLTDEFCRTHPEASPGPYVHLTVSDTGVGMDQDTASRVFEPFFTTKGAGEGTGLGLASGWTRPTILVVDDDSTFRAVTVRMLEKRGYRVLPVGDADRAASLLDSVDTAVDLMLTDVVLPGSMQGIHLAQRAARVRPLMPVLYMSGYSRDTIEKSGRLNKGQDYLEKPFTAESLAQGMREALDTDGRSHTR
jgi:two-component system cell cycle sensor histidine kinase/response regulator CckA